MTTASPRMRHLMKLARWARPFWMPLEATTTMTTHLLRRRKSPMVLSSPSTRRRSRLNLCLRARTRPLKKPTKRQEKMVASHTEAMAKEAEVEEEEAIEAVVTEATEAIGEIEEDLTPPSPRTMMKITISKLLEIKILEEEIEVEEEETEEIEEEVEVIEAETVEMPIEERDLAEEAEDSEIEVIADSEEEAVIDLKMKMLKHQLRLPYLAK